MNASSGINFIAQGRLSDSLLPNKSDTIFAHELNDRNDLSTGALWDHEALDYEVVFSDNFRGGRPLTPVEGFSFRYGPESIVPSGDTNGGHVLFMKNDLVASVYAANNNGSKKFYACTGRVSGINIIWNSPVLLQDDIPINSVQSSTIRLNDYQFITTLLWFGPSIKMYACTINPITSGITFSLPAGTSASPGDGLSQKHRYEDALSDNRFIFVIDTGLDVNNPDEGIVIGQLVGSGISASMSWGNVARPSTQRQAGSVQDIRNITASRLSDNLIVISYKPRLEEKIYTRTYSVSGLIIIQNPETLASLSGNLFLSDSERAPQTIGLDGSNWVMDCWQQGQYIKHWLMPGKIVSGTVPVYNFAKKIEVDGDFYRYDRFSTQLQDGVQFIAILTVNNNGALRLGTEDLSNQNITLRQAQRYNVQGGNGNLHALSKIRAIVGHVGGSFKAKIVDLVRRAILILPTDVSLSNIAGASKIQTSFWAKNIVDNNTVTISKDFKIVVDSSGINLNNLRWNKDLSVFQDKLEHFMVLDFTRVGASGFKLFSSIDGDRFQDLSSASGMIDGNIYSTELKADSDELSEFSPTLSEVVLLANHDLFTTDRIQNMYKLGTQDGKSITEYKSDYDIYALDTKVERNDFTLSGSGLEGNFRTG